MIVTERFLNNIQKFGKQIRLEITMNGVTKTNEGVISCSKSFNGEMFKTIMQYVEIELVGFVDVGETVSLRFGVLDEETQQYDFLNWGSFIVDKDTIERDIGTNSTRFTAYDFILKSCVEYKPLNIVYPVTVKELLAAICNRLGLSLSSTTFANANKAVKEDKFLNGEYTYRDVLDHIAGAVGGAIITKDTGLYVKYPTNTSIKIGPGNQKTMRIMKKWGPVNSLVLSLQPQEDNFYLHDEQSIMNNGLTEVKISNNELIYKERELFANEIFQKISGFSFYPFEIESFGYGCFEPYDVITVQNQEGANHPCLVLNNTVTITGGMSEQINAQMPEAAVTDYSKATSSDKALYKTLLLVDKQNQRIDMIVEEQEDLNESYAQVQIETDSIKQEVATSSEKMYLIEIGKGNLFNGCDQYVRKNETETSLKYIADMPLGIDMQGLRNKDICMSVDVSTKGAVPKSLNGRAGCKFSVTYTDNTQDVFELWFVPGVYYLALLRGLRTYDINKRIWRSFHIKDKAIRYVSNLGIYADVNGDLISVGRPKVEYGSYPTGFEFDMQSVRDSITTVEKNYTEIEQKTDSLSLKSVSLEQEVATVKGKTEAIDKRLQSTEIKLTPAEIMALVSSSINDGNGLETMKLIIDLSGLTVKNGGLKIYDGKDNLVFYLDEKTKRMTVAGWNISEDSMYNDSIKIHSDGITNIYTWADLYIIRLIVMKTVDADDDMIAHYDFNGDGVITSADYVILKNRLKAL